jgi:hypothetical protein
MGISGVYVLFMSLGGLNEKIKSDSVNSLK